MEVRRSPVRFPGKWADWKNQAPVRKWEGIHGALTPEEIAVSIVAEMIQERRKQKGEK